MHHVKNVMNGDFRLRRFSVKMVRSHCHLCIPEIQTGSCPWALAKSFSRNVIPFLTTSNELWFQHQVAIINVAIGRLSTSWNDRYPHHGMTVIHIIKWLLPTSSGGSYPHTVIKWSLSPSSG